MTLADLEAAHIRARDEYRAARRRLDAAQHKAVAAIEEHAAVHARVVSGAGATADVTRAAKARDAAVSALAAVRQELGA